MFNVFIQWFCQPPSFPVIAVDVLFFLIGSWFMLLEWRNAKRAMLYPLILVVGSILLQFAPLFFCELLAVLLCGFGTMTLLGMLAGLGLLRLLQSLNRRDQMGQQDDQTEEP